MEDGSKGALRRRMGGEKTQLYSLLHFNEVQK